MTWIVFWQSYARLNCSLLFDLTCLRMVSQREIVHFTLLLLHEFRDTVYVYVIVFMSVCECVCDATDLISHQKLRNAPCACVTREFYHQTEHELRYMASINFITVIFRVASALASTFYCFENNSCHGIHGFKCNKTERHVVEMMIFSTFRQMHTTISFSRLLFIRLILWT